MTIKVHKFGKAERRENKIGYAFGFLVVILKLLPPT